MPGNTDPQYSEWIAFSGTSVTLDGEQRYLDSHLSYQRACLHAIDYLTNFGYSPIQAYMILGAAPIEGRLSGVVDIPNSCSTVYVPTAIFDFDVKPGRRSDSDRPGQRGAEGQLLIRWTTRDGGPAPARPGRRRCAPGTAPPARESSRQQGRTCADVTRPARDGQLSGYLPTPPCRARRTGTGMERDSDRIAVWDAKARSLVARIDEALDELPEPADGSADPSNPHQSQLDALTRRVMLWSRASERPDHQGGHPEHGPQPDRADHWDAYVCRFDDADDSAPPTF